MNDAWNEFIKAHPFVKGLKCCAIEGESFRICTEDGITITFAEPPIENSVYLLDIVNGGVKQQNDR